MADKVRAIAVGGREQVFDGVDTVQDLMDEMGLENVTVKINGQSADADTELEDYNYVSFGEKVKGGLR